MNPAKRNLFLGASAVALFGVAAYMFARPKAAANFPTRYRIDGVCLSCGKESQLEYAAGAIPPFECPNCGKRTFYEWWYCYDCNKRFVPRLVAAADGGPPTIEPIPSCPACGSIRTGGYDPRDPEQRPVGDVALPKLP